MKHFYIWTITACLLSSNAFAVFGQTEEVSNTFVGNGGSTGDLELQLTLGQIKKSLKVISDSSDDILFGFLVCPTQYKGRSICEPLESLDKKQQSYVENNLRNKSKELAQVLSSHNGVKFNWTDQKILVREDGEERYVDAVANANEKKVTIYRDGFVELNPVERIFLISHELLHLTKANGKYLTDSGALGAFTGQDGGRQYLNSMGSLYAMVAYDNKIIEADSVVTHRSKSYATHWVSAALGGASDDKQSTFAQKDWGGMYLEYRQQLTPRWAYWANIRSFKSEGDFLTSTHGEAKTISVGGGVAAKFSLFSDPMKYLGQSYLLLALGAEYMHGEYELDDTYSTYEDKADSFSAVISAQYYFPLSNGFWWFVNASATHHDYEFDTNNVKPESIQTQSYLGVSYAF